MRSTIKRLKRTAAAVALGVGAQAFTGDAQAADSVVPSAWNVAPMQAGACLEAFDAALPPTWAGRAGVSVVTNQYPTMTGLPVRANEWFGANAKVLRLDTEGAVVSNTVAYPASEGAVSFASKPIYVDMRIRFDVMTDTPTPEALAGSKLAVFVASDAKLVAVHENGWITNSVATDTNLWHQLTIKMLNGVYDVLLNEQVVFSRLLIRNVGAANTLGATCFCGTGLIDNLYISHGDPAYAVTGPTGTIPSLPAPGSNPPSDVEQTQINAWLDGLNSVTSLSNLTQDELSLAYLLNELDESSGEALDPVYTFGISALDLVTPTTLVVTASLTTGSGAKSGTINGKIQLQGKVNMGDGWTTLSGAITPSFADFTNGQATYTFTIPADGYQFFKPLIVP